MPYRRDWTPRSSGTRRRSATYAVRRRASRSSSTWRGTATTVRWELWRVCLTVVKKSSNVIHEHIRYRPDIVTDCCHIIILSQVNHKIKMSQIKVGLRYCGGLQCQKKVETYPTKDIAFNLDTYTCICILNGFICS